jgi:hypothetical protein
VDPTDIEHQSSPDEEQVHSDVESAEGSLTPTQCNRHNTILENNLSNYDIEATPITSPLFRTSRPIYFSAPSTRVSRPEARETTPLLRKSISFSPSPYLRREATPLDFHRSSANCTFPDSSSEAVPHRRPSQFRRPSAGSATAPQYNYGGQSTYGQTVTSCRFILAAIVIKSPSFSILLPFY